MSHTFPHTASDHLPASGIVFMDNKAADSARRDCCPHEYYDSFRDERGKNTGARLRHNLPTEGERKRSMGCERPGSPLNQTRPNEFFRGGRAGNTKRSETISL